ncbi:hypothetical protein [Mesorhizobium sp. WSM2239]|uniref:Uncharacterized protein n=2 Tax=unclassified Mesorhizobium TaxID=325217 RepID=A0AAU8DFW2_9HYPH
MNDAGAASGIVQDIKAFPSAANAFNQYVRHDSTFEGPDAPAIRSRNLERYIQTMAMVKGRDLWLFEAPSTRGAVRTGVPQTSACWLEWRAKQLGVLEGFEAIPFHDAEKAQPSETSRRVAKFFDRMNKKPIIWNAVMIHTRTPDGKNRAPRASELREHMHILGAICDLCQPSRVIACGGPAQEVANLMQIKHECVAHPVAPISPSLGVSDVAVGKLCARLQVPKPPRGYWAKVQAGQIPRRPPLAAFREEIERSRREEARARSAESLSKLQQQFYRAALSDLQGRGVDVSGAEARGGRLPEVSPDIAAQILLAIQNRGHEWVKEGKVVATWAHPAHNSLARLVGRLLPLARPQLLVFENAYKKSWSASEGPVVFLHLTSHLQERIAALVRVVRDQKLQHVVMPLIATDHAWSVRHVFTPESHLLLDSTLCISATELWVEYTRKAWRDEDPPERYVTGRLTLKAIMPIDYMPERGVSLSPTISTASVAPYRERLLALLEAERVNEMMINTAYAIEREVPSETLAIADRLWFGAKRPFSSAREAWRQIEEELERWERELEGERTLLAQAILGIEVGDIVTSENGGRLLRLSVTGTTLYAGDDYVTFVVNGIRFRKDGTVGKLQEALSLQFGREGLKKCT